MVAHCGKLEVNTKSDHAQDLSERCIGSDDQSLNSVSVSATRYNDGSGVQA